jgi:hypothetical protein
MILLSGVLAVRRWAEILRWGGLASMILRSRPRTRGAAHARDLARSVGGVPLLPFVIN